MQHLRKVAHIEDGIVVNVSVAADEWLQENLSESILECPEYVGAGFLYDGETNTFSPPVEMVEFEERRQQALAKLEALGLTADEALAVT